MIVMVHNVLLCSRRSETPDTVVKAHPGRFCRKVRFLGKIQKSSIRNSMTYRLPNSRESNFATEPAGALGSGRVREQWAVDRPCCYIDSAVPHGAACHSARPPPTDSLGNGPVQRPECPPLWTMVDEPCY